jgi:hypothetical protein
VVIDALLVILLHNAKQLEDVRRIADDLIARSVAANDNVLSHGGLLPNGSLYAEASLQPLRDFRKKA